MSKLLDMSDTLRAALAKGRRLTPSELDDLNFVLDMMVRMLPSFNTLPLFQEEQQCALCAMRCS